MPLNAEHLAYASNDNGNGDLNCLAHFLVADFRAGIRGHERSERFRRFHTVYTAYCMKRGLPVLGLYSFFNKIRALGPVQIEKEITPVLEELISDNKSNKSRLKKLVEASNFLGIKVEANVLKQAGQQDFDVARRFDRNLKPSKTFQQTPMDELEERIGIAVSTDPQGILDVASVLTNQAAVGNTAPTMKLFLEETYGNSRGYKCYFEYPVDGVVAPATPDAIIGGHNTCIRRENDRRNAEATNKKIEDEREPSLGESVKALVTLFAGIFAKVIEICMGAYQKFQTSFANFGAPGASGVGKQNSAAPVVPSVKASKVKRSGSFSHAGDHSKPLIFSPPRPNPGLAPAASPQPAPVIRRRRSIP